MWRTWHNVVNLVGGTAMISEPLAKPDANELWRNWEIMRPSSRESSRLFTLGKSAENSIFGFAAQRAYGNFAVYNLYNSTGETKPVTLEFEGAGLPTGVRCAVFDFWANKVRGYAEDSYTSAPLEQHASALLRLTPLVAGRPVLVGSDLHLSIGATEVEGMRITGAKVELDLGGAGARNGSLIFHSQAPLKAGSARNCKVTSVEDLGENLWKVNLSDPDGSKPQSIELLIGKTH